MKITLDNNLEFLYQWDINRYVILEGVEAGTILQFTNTDLDNALSVESTIDENEVICNIPNILLTYNKDVTIFVWDGEKVIFSKRIKLISRNKPDDYIYEETKIITISNLQKEIKELDINKADNLEINNNILSLKSKDKVLSTVELIVNSFNLDEGNLIDIKTFFSYEEFTNWAGNFISDNEFEYYEIQKTIPKDKYYIINMDTEDEQSIGIMNNERMSIIGMGQFHFDYLYNYIDINTRRINDLYDRLNNVVFTTDTLILDGGIA